MTDLSVPSLGLTRREHRRLAGVLLKAADMRRPIAPLSTHFPELTVADAAQIRDTAIVDRIAQGEQLIGAKAFLGSAGEPCLGWITESMRLVDPVVHVGGLIHPCVEAKLVFVLARPLRRHIASVRDLLEVTGRVLPCLDVLDARYDGAQVGTVDAIADNCGAAHLLTGDGMSAPSEDVLARVHVLLDGDGLPRADRLPIVEATLWLANRVVEEGGELEPGALLVTPACTRAVELRAGARVQARFGPLGELALEAHP